MSEQTSSNLHELGSDLNQYSEAYSFFLSKIKKSQKEENIIRAERGCKPEICLWIAIWFYFSLHILSLLVKTEAGSFVLEKIERVNKKCFKGTSERCGALSYEVWL